MLLQTGGDRIFNRVNREIKAAIKNLDIKAKAKLLTGDGFWRTRACAEIGMPSVKLADGPHGMRVQEKRPNHLGLGNSLPATCYPTASAAACSFNLKLCEKLGEHIGKEAAYLGVSMVLGPGLNLKRSPLCGRNFEYFSEDSYLSGKIAAAYARGIQSTGVTSCLKHFAVNSREYARMYCDSRVDEQTLRETYLTGFEIAVKEGGAGAVMTAYNRVNGEYCNSSEYLLKTVLRGEWKFEGLVVSDWGGSRGRVNAIKAGADLEMPMCNMSAAEVVSAVERGELDESAVDCCIERLASFAHRSGNIARNKFDEKAHADFAAEVANESLVLLKNDGTLPLKPEEKVALIGDFAFNPRFQGAGSSQIIPVSLDNISGVIKKSSVNCVGFARGFKRFGGKSGRLMKRALRVAKKADTVVLCLGLDEDKESEGCDRKDLSINENQIELLSALHTLGKKIVVVLSCGSAVLTDWDEKCNSLLLAHLCGQSGARAVVAALTGEINPSGRLAETYLLKQGGEPCAQVYSSSPLKSDYAEGIYVGYKYYNSFNAPVKYAFGFGLSYTSFAYSDCRICGNGVKCTVKNMGAAGGATVVQLYISAPRPEFKVSPYELKGFEKVYLNAGESKEIYIPFDEYSFRVWDIKSKHFVAGGIYGISLNTDSAHKIFGGQVRITEDNVPEGCNYVPPAEIPEEEKLGFEEYFSERLSSDEGEYKPYMGMPANLEMAVADLVYCKGLVAKLFGKIALASKKSKDKIKSVALDWLHVRALLQFMNLNARQAQGFLLACDGHFFRGMKMLLSKKE